MEAREKAVQMVGYFTKVSRGSPDIEVWAKGLGTAQEWLRLIDAPSVSEQELSAFLGVIHVHRWHTAAWANMAYEAYQWARKQSAALPPSEKFFAHESLQMLEGLTAVERANTLIELFKRNTLLDPAYEPWRRGLAFTERWLALMQSESLTEEFVMTLVTAISQYSRKNCDDLWSVLHLSASRWAFQLGYADQVRAVLHGVYS